MWFRGKHRSHRDPVKLDKPDNLEQRREAEAAVREAKTRNSAATEQRGAVARMAASLAEIRELNHFAENIRAAMGGDSNP